MKNLVFTAVLSIASANLWGAARGAAELVDIYGNVSAAGVLSRGNLNINASKLPGNYDNTSLSYADLSGKDIKIIGTTATFGHDNTGELRLQLALAVCPIATPNTKVQWTRANSGLVGNGFVTGIAAPQGCELISASIDIPASDVGIKKESIPLILQKLSDTLYH